MSKLQGLRNTVRVKRLHRKYKLTRAQRSWLRNFKGVR